MLEEFIMKKVLVGLLSILLFLGCTSTTKNIEDPVKMHLVEEINGVKQFLDIRGSNSKLPVLLVVHGGYGTSETPLFNYFTPDLSNQFIAVNWDQRGAGASYIEEVPPEETMNVEQFIEDTKAVTDFISKEFNQEKIYILGHSWGSKLALLTII